MKKILVFGLVFFSFFMIFAYSGNYDAYCEFDNHSDSQYHEASKKMKLSDANKYCDNLGSGWRLATICELRWRGNCSAMNGCWSAEQLKFQGSCSEEENDSGKRSYYCRAARGWDNHENQVICAK